jgi:hypothetical protein
MSATESPNPTSLRALLGGDADPRSVVAAMSEDLPAGGIAQPAMKGRKRLLGVTYRLLDRRILEYAARSLEQDLAAPLARRLAVVGDVRDAAAATLAEPGTTRVVELGVGWPLTAKQTLTVELRAGAERLASATFVLEVTAELGETSVAVRSGAIEELICTVLSVSASLSLEDLAPPLWRPERIDLQALHLPVQPPLRVPLVPVPRTRPGAAPVGGAAPPTRVGRVSP